MSNLLRNFKRYGLRGLALSLSFIAGMAVSKPTKAMTYEPAVLTPVTYSQNEAVITITNPNYQQVSTPKRMKMFYTDEELLAQGKDLNTCDNYTYVTPIEETSLTNTQTTNEVVEANKSKQILTKKNTNGNITSVGTTVDGKTYSSGSSAVTSPNGVTTVINNNNTATVYQTVDNTLMKRDVDLNSLGDPTVGQFPENPLNTWMDKEDLGLDGVYQNSEGSTVIVSENGRNVVTIDHSTGGVSSTTGTSVATVKSLLARSAYYGQTYSEYASEAHQGQYDAGTTLTEVCNGNTCSIEQVAIVNGYIQTNGGTVSNCCSGSAYTLK